MEIKHDRLWQAVNYLTTGKEDARGRVCVVGQLLDKIHESELPQDLFNRLTNVLNKAGRKGALIDLSTGNVILDKYRNSSKRSTNKKYAEYATEILKIYEDYQPK